MKTHSTQTDTVSGWLSSVNAFVLTMILTCCFSFGSFANTTASAELGAVSFEEAELPTCKTIWIKNQGSCAVDIYEWLDTGDIFKTTLHPGQTFDVYACNHSMWRATSSPTNWGNLSYDEHWTFDYYGSDIWTIHPEYCNSGGGTADCPVTCAPNVTRECGTSIHPNQTGYPSTTCPDYHWSYSDNSNNANCPEVITRSWTGTYTGNAGGGNCSDCGVQKLIGWEMENCNNDNNYNSMGEFHPTSYNNGGCATINGSVFSNGTGMHSCVPGAVGNRGVCLDAEDECWGFMDDLNGNDTDEDKITFTMTVNPGANQQFRLDRLSFFQKAPTYIEWANAHNNIPTKFGVRVLQNGTEVFKQENYHTTTHWTEKTINLGLCADGNTTFTFELLGYCADVINNNSYEIWELDHVKLWGGCCSNISYETLSCTQTITVEDTTDPTMTNAHNQTVECNGNGNTAAFNAWLADHAGATASDACTGVTWSTSPANPSLSNDCGATGSATVEFIATDHCGNSTSRTATFTVSDTHAPVIQDASNQTVECDGNGNTNALNAWLNNRGGASANDVCGDFTWSQSPDPATVSNQCGETGSVTVTWTATDDCGNSSSTSATFTIVDTTDPVVTNAQNETVECDGSGNTAQFQAWLNNYGGATKSDVCGSTTWSTNNPGLSNLCGATGSVDVTFTATDDCGNSSSTTATFTIVDTTDPVIGTPASGQTVECDGSGNTAQLNAWLNSNAGATASDVCGNVTWSHGPANLSNLCGATGATTVTFTATDDCGNTATTQATFTIEDTTDPAVTPASNQTVECDGNGNTAQLNAWLNSNGGASASDACGNVTWSNDAGNLSNQCAETGAVLVTFTATDDCGNTSSTNATFTIEDTTNPAITDAQNETVECDGSGNTAELNAWLNNNGGATASDICGNVTWSNNAGPLSNECGATGDVTVTFTATDDCGLSSSTSATFTVIDTTNPVITDAAPQTVECDGAGNTADLNAWLNNNGGATANDVCGNVTWSHSPANLSDECGATGETTVTFTATDDCGNSSSTTATFIIEDTTNPVLTAPADETVECDGAGNQAALNAWLANNAGASASDICGNVTWSNNFNGLSDDCGATGTATIVFTATDDCGNSDSVSATFTIIDTTDPSITNASDQTVECDGNGNQAEYAAWLASNGGATGSDICGSITWSNNDSGLSDLCGATGESTVTFTATDECGNTSSTTATFTIEDTTDPVVTNASDETVECDGSGNSAAYAAWLANNGGATASDICGGVTWSNNDSGLSDDCGATGEATITFTATDECGNTSSTTATFTIVDTTDPVITAAADETVECDGAGNQAALAAWLGNNGGATASDVCSDVVWSNDFNGLSDDCGATGDALVTFTATDDCGNSSSVSATFTIVDTTNPAITDAADQTVECDGAGNTAELAAWIASQGGATASDVCGDVVWTNTPANVSDECGATGETTVTFTATDDCGNTSSTTATFTIEDTTDPEVTAPADETVECDGAGNTAALQAWLTNNAGASASDVCGDVTWSNTFTALSDDCGATGTATVDFTATDDCGNSTTVTATFTIEDTTDPTITDAADQTVECDGNGNQAEYAAWLASNGGATGSDECGSITWTNDDSGMSDECGATGESTVTFTATDECGNTSSTTATFTIEDTTDPVVTDASDMTVECDGAGNTAEYAAWLANNGGATATDVCGGVTWTNDDSGLSDDCGATGTATVTFTATDECGNTSSTSATFTIEDTIDPAITDASDQVVECDGSGNQDALAAWLSDNGGATATDACSDVVWSNDFTGLSDDCGATGTATVVFTATDDCGNASSTSATFTIEDTTDPAITDASDMTVECDGSGNGADFDAWLNNNGGATASDACSDVVWTYTGATLSDECGATGSATVTFTATDDCGNTSEATATFTIEDTTDPNISTPANDMTVECDGAGNAAEYADWLASNGGAVVEDICGDVVWTNDSTGLSDECGETGEDVVTFTATDDCGNTSTTTATFTIVDTLDPAVTQAVNETVECDGAGNTAAYAAWLANNGGATATDACSDVVWTNDGDGAMTDECGETGFAMVTFTATDDCGNSTSTTATFTIEDTTAPVMADANDMTVECDGAGNAQMLQDWLASNGGASATEDCGEVTYSNDYIVGGFNEDCGATGSVVVTFTATDDCGNTDTATATFTIEDTTAPTMDTPAADATEECDGAGNQAAYDAWLASYGGAAASDACSDVTWTNDAGPLSDECGETGSAVVTFTATDACGNETTTTATFTIEDTTPPVVECVEELVVQVGSDGVVTITAEDIDNGSADLCGELASMEIDITQFTIADAGSNTVTLTVTDDCGNTDSCQTVVIVEFFDLALNKVLAAGEDETVYPGDIVTFDIEVTNQGTIEASNILVTDYIPSGMSLADANWVGAGTSASTTIPGPLAPGASATVSIALEITATAPGQEINRAEISDADAPAPFTSDDIDSTPDATPGNDAGGEVNSGADDFVDGDGTGAPGDGNPATDEDDEDPEDVTVEIFDLALIIELGAGEADNNVYPGEEVTFTITVENQGTVTADNIDIISYLPDWFELQDADWADIVAGPSGEAGITLPGQLAPGASTTVDITVLVTGLMPGATVPAVEIIVAEIADAQDLNGDSPTDIDSTPDTDENNDAGGQVNTPADDFLGGDGTGAPGDGVAGTDEDDQDPEDVILQIFDLALAKTLAAGEDERVYPGEDVTFDIEVTNQGTVDASNIVITDYIPAGLGGGTQTLNIAGPIAPGASETVQITLTAGNAPGQEINVAEITSAEDPAGDTPADIDSTPDANPSNDAGGDVNSPADDAINGDGTGAPGDGDAGTDEDDSDPEDITIEIFDLALIIELGAGEADNNVYPGEDVTFTVTVENQGTVTADNIEVISYLPDWFVLNDANWSDIVAGPSGEAGITLPGTLAPGASTTVDITVTVTGLMPGVTIPAEEIIVAEIAAATDDLGGTPTDIDSVPDTVENNDAGGLVNSGADDFLDGDGTGTPGDGTAATDEDDQDPEDVFVQVFDLALIKVLAAGEDATVYPGEDITFDIEVTNQGSVAASNIVITDYIPAGLGGGTQTLNIAGPLAPGASETVSITLTAGTTPGDEVNRAEITSAEDPAGDSPDDIDSTPDAIEGNDAGGAPDSPSDNVVDGDASGAPGDTDPATDEDDEDPELITIEVFDLALVKTVASDGPFYPGMDITFQIEVFNQGTVPASNVAITDFAPAGLGGGTQTLTIAGPIAPGASETVDVTYTISATDPGTQVNLAEIASAEDPNGDSPTDIDSVPDTDPTNDAGGNPDSPSDDVVNGDGSGVPGDDNPATDEDDSDPAAFDVDIFDLALIIELGAGEDETVYPGEDVTFTVTVENQGTVPADMIDVIAYLPDWFELNDAAWADIVAGPSGEAGITLPGTLAPGASTTVDITVTVTGLMPGATVPAVEIIVAEIAGAEDTNGNAPTDIDSVPDSVENNDAGGLVNSGADDFLDGDGTGTPGDGTAATDEDDQDPEDVTLEIFDLALTKVVAPGQPSIFYPGDDVEFLIEVTNQGTVAASNIAITDYAPAGLGGGTQTLNIAGPIAPGASETVSVTLTITATDAGQEVNVAEIASAEDPNGDSPADVDSTPDTDPTNDAGGAPESPADNAIGGDGNGTPGGTDPLTDEDDSDPALIDVEVFDLALIKTLSDAGPFYVGDDATFTIEVFNQGTVAASNVEVIDYIPSGFSLSPADGNGWVAAGGNATNTVAGPIAPGSSTTIDIVLTLGDVAGDFENVAEITDAQDPDGNSPADADSTPDTDPSNDPVLDDEINGAGGDEDDADPAPITVDVFDLALNIVLDPSEADTDVYPGEDITFLVEVTNQGTVTAANIDVISYLPDWFVLNDADWSDVVAGPGGQAGITIPGILAPGATVQVPITVTVTPVMAGMTVPAEEIIVAEIAGATDQSGNTPTDVDSTPDTNPSNDAGGLVNSPADDFIDGDGSGTPGDGTAATDEDDQDPEDVTVQVFDLALTKKLAAGQSENVYPGQDVEFVIEVTNQGTVPAQNIVISDYAPAGLGGGTQTLTIAGPIAPGASADVTITLPVTAAVAGQEVNVAEITSAEDGNGDAPADADSFPDSDPNNDAGGQVNGPTDDTINNENGDEDDSDPEDVTVEIFDLALRKGAASPSVIYPGADVTFPIEVFNQGTVAAQNVEVIDYIPAGFTLNDPNWTAVGGNATTTIAAIPVGGSVVVNITLTAGAGVGEFENFAEITSAEDPNGFNAPDADSTPDADNTNDALTDDEINNANGDEDDHDVAPVTVEPCPEATITGETVVNCYEASVDLTADGGVVGETYSWTGPGGFTSAAMTITVSAPGTYTVIITNPANGCTDEAEIVVTEDLAEPDAAAVGGEMTCIVTDVTLDGSSSTAGVTYAWTGPAGFTSTQEDPTVSVAGTYTLTVTATGNGCSTTVSTEVTEDITPPDATAEGGEITCNFTSVTMMGNTTTAGATYSWTGPGGFTSSVQNPSVSAPGDYTLTVTGPNGCTALASATVTEDTTEPDVSAQGGLITCSNGTAQICASSTTADVTYRWSGPDGIIGTDACANVTTGGAYTILVTGPNGCTNSMTVIVEVDITPPTAEATGGEITCSAGTVNINGSSTTAGVTYAWSGPGGFTSSAQSASVSAPGSYILTVTGPNGCSAEATAVVTSDTTAPNASATGGTITCSTTSVTLAGSSSTAGVTYAWAGPAGFTSAVQNPSVSAGGTYTLTVTAPNGCTETATATVTMDNAAPVASATGGTISCNQTSVTLSGSADVTVTYSWTGPAGFNSSAANPSVSNPGVYTLTVTAANGCTDTADATVTGDTTPPEASCSGGTITCSQPTVTMSSSTNIGGATYSWTGPGGFTSSDPNPVVSAAGNYVLTVTAGNGCSASTNCEVFADTAPPTVSCVGGTISCANGSAQLTASGTGIASYSWSGPGGFTGSGASVSATAAGVYTVTATATNGCTATSQCEIISDSTPPTVSCTAGVISCANTTATLTATGNGASYTWTGPNGFTATGTTASTTVAGVYTVTAYGANGCSAQSTCEVTSDVQGPTVSCSGGTISCANPNATLTASGNATSYSWSGPSGPLGNGASISVSAPGVYTVTGYSANGCSTTSTCTVTGDTNPPSVSCAGGAISCANPTATVTANAIGAVSYAWSGPSGPIAGNVASITVAQAGNYTVTVTAANGCTAISSCVVTGDTVAPNVSCTGGTISCANPTATVTATATGATSYSWSGPTGPIAGNTASITASVAGNYTVTVTSANGCTAFSSCVVSGDTTAPSVSCTGGTISCANPTTTVTASATGAASYSWSGPNGPIAGNTASITASAAGNYTVTVTSANGCSASSSCVVTGDTTAPTVYCNGGTLDCNATSTTVTAVATGATSYSWSGPNGPIAGNTASITANVAGNYTVTVTSANGCSASSTCTVSGDTTVPTVSCIGGAISCASPVTSVTASATGATSYSWSGPSGPIAGNVASITANVAGTYTVTVFSANGCSATSSCTVTGDTTAPQVSCTGGTITCASPTTTVSANAPAGSTYNWTGPNGGYAGNTASITASVAGNYTVSVTGPNGCTAQAVCTVTGSTAGPSVSCTGGTISCTSPTVTVSANAVGASSYSWSGPNGPIAGNAASITASEVGVYTVTVTDANGCSASSSCNVVGNAVMPECFATGGSLTCDIFNVVLQGGSNALNASYSWSGPNGYTSNEQNPLVSQPGVYTLTVTTGPGCTCSTQAQVYEDNQGPALQATGGTLGCNGSATQLSASTANDAVIEFSWSGPNGFTSNISNPTVSVAGNYVVTATNVYTWCASSMTVSVVDGGSGGPAVTATGGAISCTSPTVTVSASSPTGVSYSWIDPAGNPAGNAAAITASFAGNYTVTVTDASGCSSTAVATVTGNADAPVVSATANSLLNCNAPSVQLFASSATTGSYTWSGPNGFSSTEQNPFVSAPGTYSVTITGGNGCTGSALVSVAQETCIDLELSKKVDLPTCFMGDILTYTIAVTNNGPGNATNVYVLDQLPGEVLYLESTASQGSYDVTTGFWQVGNVPAGAEIMLEIVVYVTDDTSPIVNFAQVHSAGETDIDSVPGNAAFGGTMEDDEGMAMTYPQGGDQTTGGSGSGADGTGDTDGVTSDGMTDDGMTDDGMSDGGDSASGGEGGDTVGVTDTDTAGSDGMTDDGGDDGSTDDGGDDGSADDTGVAGDDTGVVVTDTADTAGGDDSGVVDPTPCGTGVACTEEITPIEICPDFCTDGLAVTDVETTYHCSWVINDNGCITYTPLPGMSMIGTDTVVIIGCDAAGNCEEFTVTVQVGGCADACSVTPAVIELADGGDAATVCAGSDDIVSIVVANAPSGNTDGAYVITDATGTEILAGPLAGPNFEFTDAPAGTCLIWHVSWDTNINIPTNMVADITGDCVELSNAITVVREECAPDPEPCDASGQTYCASPAIPVEICPEFCTVSNYEITSVEAIYLCSIALNGECFTYTALPAFMGDEMLTVTACEGDVCEEIVVAVGVVADCGDQGTDTAGGDDGGEGDDTGGADDGGDDDTGGDDPCTADVETCTSTMTPVDVCVSFCEADLSISAITSDMNAGITQLNPTCFRFIPLPNFSGVHTLMVTGCNDAGDCETAEVIIDVTEDCTGGIGVVGLVEYTVKAAQFLNPLVKSANAFSPNQDGINDVWKLGQVDPNLYGEKVAVSILDQNGQVILQDTDDVEYMFWDGTMQNGGTDVPEGTYFFVLEMEINGMKIIDKGFIELKR